MPNISEPPSKPIPFSSTRSGTNINLVAALLHAITQKHPANLSAPATESSFTLVTAEFPCLFILPAYAAYAVIFHRQRLMDLRFYRGRPPRDFATSWNFVTPNEISTLRMAPNYVPLLADKTKLKKKRKIRAKW